MFRTGEAAPNVPSCEVLKARLPCGSNFAAAPFRNQAGALAALTFSRFSALRCFLAARFAFRPDFPGIPRNSADFPFAGRRGAGPADRILFDIQSARFSAGEMASLRGGRPRARLLQWSGTDPRPFADRSPNRHRPRQNPLLSRSPSLTGTQEHVRARVEMAAIPTDTREVAHPPSRYDRIGRRHTAQGRSVSPILRGEELLAPNFLSAVEDHPTVFDILPALSHAASPSFRRSPR